MKKSTLTTLALAGVLTFGGGAVVGVASTSPKKGFHVFNKKEYYKDWLFIYDPSVEGKGLIKGPYNGPQTTGSGTIPGATPAGQLNQTTPTSSSPFSSGFGSGSSQPQSSGTTR